MESLTVIPIIGYRAVHIKRQVQRLMGNVW